MRKIKTSDIVAGAGYPPSKKGLDFLQQIGQEMYSALGFSLARAMGLQGASGFPVSVALFGCEKTDLGGGLFSFNTGYIYIGNGGLGEVDVDEIFYFPGIGSIAIPDTAILTITTSNDATADPTTFSDGSIHNVHNLRTLVVSSGVSGSADLNYSALKFPWQVSYTTITRGVSYDAVGGKAFQFFKDALGYVYIQGAVSRNSTLGPSALGTLPAGSRPSQVLFVPVVANNGASSVEIDTAGAISVNGPDYTTGDIIYFCCKFKAA